MKQKTEKKTISKMVKNILFILNYTWNVDKFIFFYYILQFCTNGLKPFVPIAFTALIFNSLQNKDGWETVLIYAVIMLALIALFDIVSTFLEYRLILYDRVIAKKSDFRTRKICNDNGI